MDSPSVEFTETQLDDLLVISGTFRNKQKREERASRGAKSKFPHVVSGDGDYRSNYLIIPGIDGVI